jgi:hypothetical protein
MLDWMGRRGNEATLARNIGIFTQLKHISRRRPSWIG